MESFWPAGEVPAVSRTVVLREHTLPPLGALSGRRSKAAPGGSHDDLRAHSGHLHPLLLARAGGGLAGWVAWHDLGPCCVRHSAQAVLDGGPALSVALYLGMGWVGVMAAPALFLAVPTGGIAWVLGGGLLYTAGALIYGLKRPNLVPGIFGFHELWHLFVVAGSACHFWAVLHYVAPLA